jgi:hypothetical protein
MCKKTDIIKLIKLIKLIIKKRNIFVIFIKIEEIMMIEKFVNRLGIYEKYQSGGCEGNKGGNVHNKKPYYSTPNYMSFLDAMYLSKNGFVRHDGTFALSHRGGSLRNYFMQLHKWTSNLNNHGIHNVSDVMQDPQNTQKALKMYFNVFSDETSGRGKTNRLITGGGFLKSNKEPFSLILKGNEEFKPVFFMR